jgi:hypothetical protein
MFIAPPTPRPRCGQCTSACRPFPPESSHSRQFTGSFNIIPEVNLPALLIDIPAPVSHPDKGQPLSLAINDIPDMSVYSRNGFVFSDAAGTHYEIKSVEKKSPLNVRKYISIWKVLRGG